jgi:propionyl-CoA synthetase
MEKVSSGHDVVPVDSTHPFFVLYTSGTTGQPKGIYRSHGGQSVAFNYKMKHIFNINAGDSTFTPSDIGWIVGHNFVTYGPLFRGSSSLMFEGKPVGTPDAGVLWRLIEEHKVNCFFIAPTAVRAIMKEDSEGKLVKKHDMSTVTGIHLAGERCDPATIHWL